MKDEARHRLPFFFDGSNVDFDHRFWSHADLLADRVGVPSAEGMEKVALRLQDWVTENRLQLGEMFVTDRGFAGFTLWKPAAFFESFPDEETDPAILDRCRDALRRALGSFD